MTEEANRAARDALKAARTVQIRKGPKWVPVYDATGLLLGVADQADVIPVTLVPAVGRPATQPPSRKAFQ
jgi:hypothetical protein